MLIEVGYGRNSYLVLIYDPLRALLIKIKNIDLLVIYTIILTKRRTIVVIIDILISIIDIRGLI